MGKEKESAVDCINGQLNDLSEESIHPSSANWRSLFNFTSKAHKVHFAVAIISSVASGIIIPALAVFLGKLFGAFTSYGGNHTSGAHLLQKMLTYDTGLMALGCTAGVLNAVYLSSWIIFGELQAKSAREKIFGGVLDKKMEWFDTRMPGIETLTSRLQMYEF